MVIILRLYFRFKNQSIKIYFMALYCVKSVGVVISEIIDILRNIHPKYKYRFDDKNFHLLINRTEFAFYFEKGCSDLFVIRLKKIDDAVWEFCGDPISVHLGDPKCFDSILEYIDKQYFWNKE
jgi:hypothetical protein